MPSFPVLTTLAIAALFLVSLFICLSPAAQGFLLRHREVVLGTLSALGVGLLIAGVQLAYETTRADNAQKIAEESSRQAGRVENLRFVRQASMDRTSDNSLPLAELDLQGQPLMGLNLRYASLFGSNLSNALLGSSDLTGSVLHAVNLTDADLGFTNLKDVSYYYTDFRGAKLHDAVNFDVSKLRMSCWDEHTTWPDSVIPLKVEPSYSCSPPPDPREPTEWR